jgi:hypothetical protein
VKKVFSVRIPVDVVVVAEDADDAIDVALDNFEQMVSDTSWSRKDFESVGEIPSIELLPKGWDGMCFPYGDETQSMKRLKDILKST